jgi:hypothetical protein
MRACTHPHMYTHKSRCSNKLVGVFGSDLETLRNSNQDQSCVCVCVCVCVFIKHLKNNICDPTGHILCIVFMYNFYKNIGCVKRKGTNAFYEIKIYTV